MCCRACSGYEACRTKGRLAGEDCCVQCRYFNSCMEEADEEERPHEMNRRYPR